MINAKVAEILDKHSVALNRGSQHGVKLGSIYQIGTPVDDPETGQLLGSIPRVKVRVKDVYELFCVAETFESNVQCRQIVVDVGDEAVEVE